MKTVNLFSPPASGEQTIVVTDKAGNETRVIVTVNDGHTTSGRVKTGSIGRSVNSAITKLQKGYSDH